MLLPLEFQQLNFSSILCQGIWAYQFHLLYTTATPQVTLAKETVTSTLPRETSQPL